jgi:hypothetical protein
MLTQLDAHVFDTAVADRAQPPDKWEERLERFTARNVNRHVVVEEDRIDRGIMRSVVDAELTGISYDRRDGNVQIMLDGRDARAPHRTVVVRNVQSVDSLSAPDGRDVALRLSIPKGQVLLTFVPSTNGSVVSNGW